jgi:hypothetical protein
MATNRAGTHTCHLGTFERVCFGVVAKAITPSCGRLPPAWYPPARGKVLAQTPNSTILTARLEFHGAAFAKSTLFYGKPQVKAAR